MCADIPDVAGLYLEEARDLLGAAGIAVEEVLMTAPPRLRDGAGAQKLRVILARDKGNGGISLLVTLARDIEELF
jgi:hypothetical protein